MSRTGDSLLKSMVLLVWAVALTGLTVVFGAVPLLPLRKILGRVSYWGLCLGVALLFQGLGLTFFAISFLAVASVVGILNEFQIQSDSPADAAVHTVVVSSALGGAGLLFWTYWQGTAWLTQLKVLLESSMESIQTWGMNKMQLNADELLLQAPSAMVIVIMLSIFFSLLWSPRLQQWAGINSKLGSKLNRFRLPDVFVWIFIFSFLGTFLKTDVKAVHVVSVNLLNISLVAYFFQGLAVIARFFSVYRVSSFWRIFWYFILVVQLFLIVSVIGLVDFWADFRSRFAKKEAQANKVETK